MDEEAAKQHLQRYLRRVRESVVWKLDGLSEYDVRRPLTPTGTNLLGLVKHLSIVEAWYFGQAFDRPFPEHLDWWDDDAEPNVDMWATPEETREEIVDRFRRATAHADATIAALPLDAPGHVSWWDPPATTLHAMLVHVLAEENRHAGHADILREELDGAAGIGPSLSNLADPDDGSWEEYRAKIERAAASVGSAP